MLHRTHVSSETWRHYYHRLRIPRQLALRRYREQLEIANAKKGEGHVPQKPYRYNRWFVGINGEFIHQHHFIEDPEVVLRRRTTMPEPTASDTWKRPVNPFFDDLLPFVDTKDYPKDPDVKFLKPANIPRWKDFMRRKKPMVPRVWY